MADHPDWGRFGITPPNKFSALGDPTRWGATVVQDTNPAYDGSLLQTGQILHVQCRDAYPRAWTLAGTIQAPSEFFLLPNDPFDASGQYWVAAVYVSMGVGQVPIVHSFDIREIVTADEPYYWNSDISNPFFTRGANGFSTFPFIMPGALVGTAMNVQILQAVKLAIPIPSVPITTSLIVTPFDSGVTPTPAGAHV